MLIGDLIRRIGKQPDSKDPKYALTPGLAPFELAERIRSYLYDAKTYARWRRQSWRTFASGAHLLTLASSATATVILGLAELEGIARWGFIFSALVTVVGSLELFFNWRSRWILAEEALSEWHRIEENLRLYVAATPAASLNEAKIVSFYDEYREVWNQFSNQWLEQRRSHAKVSG